MYVCTYIHCIFFALRTNGVHNSLQSTPSAANMGTVEEKKPIGDPVKPSDPPDSAL